MEVEKTLSDDGSISSRDYSHLQRQDPTHEITDWAEWIRWLMKHYRCSQTDIAKKQLVSPTFIGHLVRGAEPSDEMKLSLASWAIDRGPLPPEFRVPRRLQMLTEMHINGAIE